MPRQPLAYGPFAGEIANRIDTLTRKGTLMTITGADRDSDKDFVLYKLGHGSAAPTLQSLHSDPTEHFATQFEISELEPKRH